MPDFTPEQNAAIYTEGADILVSAAAGSGKTAVLVERIIHKITRDFAPVDITNLLIVTFTDAASIEMRRRIEHRLNELLTQDPGNLNIRKQIALLPGARISTIHTFCSRLIKEHINLANIDPGYSIADPAEALILKQEAIEEVLEAEYAREDNAAFTDLVEIYGGKYTDTNLRGLIMRVYEFLLASPWPKERISDYTAIYEKAADKSFFQTPWAALFADLITSKLEEARDLMQTAVLYCTLPDGPLAYEETMLSDLDDIETLFEYTTDIEKNWRVFSGFEFTASRLKSVKKTDNVDEAYQEAAKKARTDAKKIISTIQDTYFSAPLSEQTYRISQLGRIITALADIVIKFFDKYAEYKRERNLTDYNDLEQYALKILYTEGSNINNHTPSDTAIEIQNTLEEVLTDEYQDSNTVQELILKAVAKPGHRFMVGDIKQSIYRFRQAKPQIFIDKYDTYKPYSEDNFHSNIKINLCKNFRSVKNVTDTINFLFCQLMSREAGEVDYDEDAALFPAADYPDAEQMPDDTTEVCIIETRADTEYEETESEDEQAELPKAEAEAHYIARRIKTMVCGVDKQLVYDKNEACYRPARYSDITILSHSVRTISEAYTDIFNSYGIPLYIGASDGGYFKSLEIMTVMSILNVIDNPKQDIHLLAVLHSPIYGITGDELVEIREQDRTVSFYDCLLLYIKNNPAAGLTDKINAFLTDFAEISRLAVFTPMSELLWIIYDKTHYYEYAGAMPGGEIRKANLKALCERAAAYEKTKFKGMFHFLKFIERVKQTDADIREAKLISQNMDAVRLLTIHSSKGLEFPIVFLASAYKKFNYARAFSDMVLDAEYGFGADYFDLDGRPAGERSERRGIENRIKYPTLPKAALIHKARKEDMSERLRVLYVALTRAKEKLIITSVVNNYEKAKAKWQTAADSPSVRLPRYYVLNASCFADFIMPCILRHEAGRELPYNTGNIRLIQGEITIPDEQTAAMPPDITQPAEPVHTTELSDDIPAKLAWQYPHTAAAHLPSKISISEIKRLYQIEQNGADSALYFEPAVSFKEPRFGDDTPKPADIGTAIHTVMERIKLSPDTAENEIIDLINKLIEKNLIDEKTAAGIPVNKILAFLQSPLCARIAQSPRVMREAPFVLSLTPREIYYETEAKDETILTHGIIDLYFEEPDGFVLVDYKSDHIKPGCEAAVTAKYTPQLGIYKKALEKAGKQPVKEVYLYLFGINAAILCEV